MRKITLLLIALVCTGSLIVGFLLSDPFGSKTTGSSEVNPPIGIPVNPDLVTVYTDNMDGSNDTNALKARGYKVWYRGSGPQGLTATWFSPSSPPPFNAFNGPTTGYVAANYNVVTGTNNIDSWLVLPRLASGGILAGDSLYFYSRAPTGSTYPDSIRVMYSATDSIPEGSWTELGRFKVNTLGSWERRGFRAPTASANGRFAIRYNVVNGGPNGSNSDFIGVDAVTIERSAAPPGSLNQPDEWCSNYPALPGSGVLWGHASVALGDTLYVAGGDATAGATTNVYRYAIPSNTWSTGVPLPGPKSGGDLAVCNGKLYYIGGGASLTVGNGITYEYTPSTGQWVTKASQPTMVTGNVAEGYNNTHIYCISGGWSTYTTTIQLYNVATNTWSTATSLPAGTGRRSFAGGLWNGKIYVCAGYSAAYRNDLQIGTINPSDPSQITWAAGPSIAQNTSRPGGTAIADRFYVAIGEVTGGSGSDSIAIFNTITNTWSYVPGKPNAYSNYWGAVSGSYVNCNGRLGVKIWIPGGALGTASNRPLDVFADTCLINCQTVTSNGNPIVTIPKEYSLSQNYPNPFNPSTKISFSIPKVENVSLVIYDLTGREVAKLVNKTLQAGTHVIDFNASNLASGVYIYRIEAGTFTDSKKMLLIK
jgi:hypothetical protein